MTSRRTNSSKRVDAKMNEKVNLRELRQPGTYLSMYEKLVLELARELQYLLDPTAPSTSWECQEAAQKYFNEHGFEETLDHRLRLEQAREAETNL